MCFIRLNKHQADNSPRVVYKVMRLLTADKVMSVYYHTTKYHSIGSTLRASKDIPVDEIDKLYTVEGEAVHAYTNKFKATSIAIFIKEFFGLPTVVVECVIPASDPYWINENSAEIVAKEMKIINIDI